MFFEKSKVFCVLSGVFTIAKIPEWFFWFEILPASLLDINVALGKAFKFSSVQKKLSIVNLDSSNSWQTLAPSAIKRPVSNRFDFLFNEE